MVVTRRDELTRITTLLPPANWNWAALALLTAVGVLLAGGRAVLDDLAWTMAVVGLVAAAVAVLIERGGLARLAIAGGTWLALGWQRLTRRPATDARQQAEDGWRQL